MRASGASLFEIALEFDVSRQAVWQRVKDVTCPISHAGGPKRKADPSAILRLRATGLTYAQIAERLGLSATTVHKYISRAAGRSAGGPVRKGTGARQPTCEGPTV